MNLPRIRHIKSLETWLYRATLVGFPRPGIGLVVELYQPQNTTEPWIVGAFLDPEAGR